RRPRHDPTRPQLHHPEPWTRTQEQTRLRSAPPRPPLTPSTRHHATAQRVRLPERIHLDSNAGSSLRVVVHLRSTSPRGRSAWSASDVPKTTTFEAMSKRHPTETRRVGRASWKGYYKRVRKRVWENLGSHFVRQVGASLGFALLAGIVAWVFGAGPAS